MSPVVSRTSLLTSQASGRAKARRCLLRVCRVDKFFIESLSEDIGWRAPIGIVSCCWDKPFGAMADWQAMPEVFLIRWFSFAEQQSYEALIRLENPDEIEEKMKETAPFEAYGKIVERPRDVLVLGLAPGGTVVAGL